MTKTQTGGKNKLLAGTPKKVIKANWESTRKHKCSVFSQIVRNRCRYWAVCTLISIMDPLYRWIIYNLLCILDPHHHEPYDGPLYVISSLYTIYFIACPPHTCALATGPCKCCSPQPLVGNNLMWEHTHSVKTFLLNFPLNSLIFYLLRAHWNIVYCLLVGELTREVKLCNFKI